MLKILGVFDRPFLPRGGAEISTLEYWSLLKEEGFELEVFSFSYRNEKDETIKFLNLLEINYQEKKNKITYISDNIKVSIFFENSLEESIISLSNLIQKYKPDVFYSFFIDLLAIEISETFKNIPIIYFIYYNEYPRPNQLNSKIKKYILKHNNYFVSTEFMQNSFFNSWGIKPKIFKDYINPEKYKIKNYKPEYITMFNPDKVKGINIFLKIASELKSERFLIVGNWKLYLN